MVKRLGEKDIENALEETGLPWEILPGSRHFHVIHHTPPTIPVGPPVHDTPPGRWTCPHCHGGYFVHYEGAPVVHCDECNGTGIKGDPHLGFLVIALSVVTTIGPLLVWYFA